MAFTYKVTEPTFRVEVKAHPDRQGEFITTGGLYQDGDVCVLSEPAVSRALTPADKETEAATKALKAKFADEKAKREAKEKGVSLDSVVQLLANQLALQEKVAELQAALEKRK